MTKFVSKWLIDPSVSSVSASQVRTGHIEKPSVSSVSANEVRIEAEIDSSHAHTSTRSMSFSNNLPLDNDKTDGNNTYAQYECTAKTDESPEASTTTPDVRENHTAKTDRNREAELLLITLRTRNVRLRIDGDVIRCKPVEGTTIPADLADQIRALKPGLLELLREEDAAIIWRAESGLLNESPAVQPIGACADCGVKMPGNQTGRCVLCCLAAAQVYEERLAKTEATYPLTDIAAKSRQLEALQVDDRRSENGLRDMSPERKDAA